MFRGERRLSFLAFPGSDFAAPGHYIAFMAGKRAYESRLLTIVMIDVRTGRVVETSALPWFVSTLLLAQPLHFGDYGGPPLKVAWLLFDLASIGNPP